MTDIKSHGASWAQALNSEIDELSNRLDIPQSVRGEAMRICDVTRANWRVKCPAKVLAIASVYAACREAGVPFAFRDLAVAIDLQRYMWRDAARCYRRLVRRIGISILVAEPGTYVQELASDLHEPDAVVDAALALLRFASKYGVYTGGRNPRTMAAAALYTALVRSGKNVTEMEVAQMAGVSEMSVREAVKVLRKVPQDSF